MVQEQPHRCTSWISFKMLQQAWCRQVTRSGMYPARTPPHPDPSQDLRVASSCIWLRAEVVTWAPALQRQNTEILKQIFPENEYRGLSPNFHIHTSVSDLYIPTIGLPILLEERCRPILGLYKSITDTRMLKLGLKPRYSQKRNT